VSHSNDDKTTDEQAQFPNRVFLIDHIQSDIYHQSISNNLPQSHISLKTDLQVVLQDNLVAYNTTRL
jgi:hypothetical protein